MRSPLRNSWAELSFRKAFLVAPLTTYHTVTTATSRAVWPIGGRTQSHALFYCIRTVCASRGIIVIDYGMIVPITTTSIKMKGYPGLLMLDYFIQSSEYHVIPVQAKDDYASRNQQDYILKASPA